MNRTERALTVLTFVNFFAALALAMFLGGDAFQGRVEDGHYWLGYKGRYQEVSAGTYWFSRLQLFSVFITHPLGMYAQWRGGQRAKKAREEEA
jgi:hypothetical protein